MKDEQIGRNHPPSIEEDFEEVLSFNLISDDSGNESLEASAAANGISPEPFFPWKKELVCLVRGGLPKALRGEVWQAFVGARKRRMERYYQNLIASETNAGEGKDYGSSLSVNGSKQPNADHAIPEKWRRQIEKDLPRTFPGHPALDKVGRDSLRHLLLAHAQHNPSVGYCQASMEACSNAPKSGTVEFKPLEVPILLLTEGNAFKKHGPKAGTTDFKPLGANSPTY
ncbi:hypothetical protein VitviT2T_012206 [Vitis vinifera]|uniref:Rab-GAP TBC domain-containing protein n=1 Tax=Vitis vinifera TaxID=29760 RepID=A0ABY9CFN6_VITVI|nr:hypothetical protein VitviT2T_012206 [Vitis vinifera]